MLIIFLTIHFFIIILWPIILWCVINSPIFFRIVFKMYELKNIFFFKGKEMLGLGLYQCHSWPYRFYFFTLNDSPISSFHVNHIKYGIYCWIRSRFTISTEIQFRTTFTWSLFWCYVYFWQWWIPKWIKFPFSVHYKSVQETKHELLGLATLRVAKTQKNLFHVFLNFLLWFHRLQYWIPKVYCEQKRNKIS